MTLEGSNIELIQISLNLHRMFNELFDPYWVV